MTKCPKCGKKFETLSALNDHYKAVHPNERLELPKANTSRNLTVIIVIVIVAVSALIGTVVYLQSSTTRQTTTTTTDGLSQLNQPINNSLYNQMTEVSSSTLISVGKGSATDSGLSKPGGTPLMLNGKPEFLFISADYCPYCAVERWAIVVALSQFGTLSGLQYMLSGPSDGNISTVTFSNVSYTSNYVAFQAIEIADRSGNPLQTMTQPQQTLFTQYDSSKAIPFIDIYNKYVIVGAQPPISSVSNNIFTRLSWSQIGSQLNTPSSAIAKAVDGSANYLISMICSVDGNQPSSVCGQSFGQIPVAIGPAQNLQQGYLVLSNADVSMNSVSGIRARIQ